MNPNTTHSVGTLTLEKMQEYLNLLEGHNPTIKEISVANFESFVKALEIPPGNTTQNENLNISPEVLGYLWGIPIKINKNFEMLGAFCQITTDTEIITLLQNGGQVKVSRKWAEEFCTYPKFGPQL